MADRQVEVTLPSLEERVAIFKVHLRKIKVNEEFDKEIYAKKLAMLTPGFSGADIENICNEAAIQAARGDLKSLSSSFRGLSATRRKGFCARTGGGTRRPQEPKESEENLQDEVRGASGKRTTEITRAPFGDLGCPEMRRV